MTISTLDYALMAGAAYYSTRHSGNRVPFPSSSGWLPLDEMNRLDHRLDSFSGFEAVAFINQSTHEIVISYAGTNGTKDVTGDWLQGNLANATGLPSRQLILAAKYYQDVKKLYGTYDISFTGHSLGGGLAALMGVFFNKTAVTFDAAPFRNAASIFNQALLFGALSDYPLDTDLLNFYSALGFVRGEGKVSGFVVDGEALTAWLSPIFARIGRQEPIPHGPAGTATPVDLHDIELLMALREHPAIGSASLPFLLGDLYDEKLFASDDRYKSTPDFLTHLIRYEFGVPGVANSDKDLLTKFAADAKLVAGFADADNSLKQGLMQLAMQSYYGTVTSTGKTFFDAVGGGVRFDLSGDIGDGPIALNDLKGHAKLLAWIFGNTSAEAAQAITDYLATGRRMTLTLGNSAAAAPSDNIADFMLSGINGGWLAGGDGNDLLVGRNGQDALTGGKGDDTLIGGNGIDSYLYKIGDGNDTIIDADKKGRIFVSAVDNSWSTVASIFIKDQNNPNQWQSADGKLTLSQNGNWKISIDGGGGIDLGQSFTEGDYGIHRKSGATQSNTVTGDQNTDKRDYLAGTADGDVIQGKTDQDILNGWAGDDRLYGDGEIPLAQAIADGRTGAGTGVKGEWLNGAVGDDILVAGASNDVLMGGPGKDILVGGAGDDLLDGDDDCTATSIGWSVTPVNGNPFNSIFGPISSRNSSPPQGDDDILHGGAGKMTFSGGWGDDVIHSTGNDAVMRGADRGPSRRASMPPRKAGETYDLRSIVWHNDGRYTSRHTKRADANAYIRAHRRHPANIEKRTSRLPVEAGPGRFGRIAA